MINLKLKLDPNNMDHMNALANFAATLAGQKTACEQTKEVIKETLQPENTEVKIEKLRHDITKKQRTKKESSPVEPVSENVVSVVSETNEDTVKKQAIVEETTITLEDLRLLTREKAPNHKEVIKAKLTELNAENVTQLKPEQYLVYYEYLNSLK